jgi:alpha-galactosidase
VALTGRFGFDLDLASLSEDELAVCRRAVAVARRTQGLVQRGELVRLVSPVDGEDRSRAALAHLSDDRRRVLVAAYQLEDATSPAPRLLVPDLVPDASYRLRWTDLRADEPVDAGTLTGAELGSTGLDWPLGEPLTARLWELAVDEG